MYIFAEPVTEEQVADIQSQNDAKIQEFENKILGIARGEGSQSQDPQEEDRRWADIQASVQEAMDKDELSVDKNSENQEAQYLKLDENDADAGQGRLLEQGPLYAKKSQVNADDDASAAAAGDEDDDVEEGDEEEDDDVEDDEDLVEESDDEDAENESAQENEEENKNNQEDDVENEAEDERIDEVEETEDETKEGSIDGEMIEGDHSVTAANEQSAEAENAAVAKTETLNLESVMRNPPDVSITDGQVSSTSEESNSENSDIASSATGEGTSASPEEDYISSQGEDEEFRTDADRPFLEAISQENHPDSESDDVLAMTLTLRNKINGHYVLRPENLTKEDKWSIEYSLSEVATQSRAKALYEACQVRRKKKLDMPMAPGDQEVISGYARRLREMSSKGREWRDEMDERDAERPVHVLGTDIAKKNGEISLKERELED